MFHISDLVKVKEQNIFYSKNEEVMILEIFYSLQSYKVSNSRGIIQYLRFDQVEEITNVNQKA